MTDFYCEFKERKQVAAIYDSYPILGGKLVFVSFYVLALDST